MSDQIFLLSDQNGALVGHMSFQGKNNFLQPCAIQLPTNTFNILFIFAHYKNTISKH